MPDRVRAVLDASAVLRAVVDESEEAREWIERIETGSVDGYAPDLLHAEVANALVNLLRARFVHREQAGEILAAVGEIPLSTVSSRDVSLAACGVAISRDVTAYDAHYLALAEVEDAVLLTADRSMAEAASASVLLE